MNTAELPPAYYYTFVQHPGSDNRFNINIKGYSGEVVNTNTGTVIFNFTGSGSVNDNAAAIALSNAFNSIGMDDVFSKTGVQLLPMVSGANGTTTTASSTQPSITVADTSKIPDSKPAAPAAIPATIKAPLSIISSVLGIGLVGIGIAFLRKN